MPRKAKPPVPEPMPQQQMRQVDPAEVLGKMNMLLLGMGAFHPADLDAVGQWLKAEETRAKLDPNVPVEVARSVGYNARLVGATRAFQLRLLELQQQEQQAALAGNVLTQGGIILPGERRLS